MGMWVDDDDSNQCSYTGSFNRTYQRQLRSDSCQDSTFHGHRRLSHRAEEGLKMVKEEKEYLRLTERLAQEPADSHSLFYISLAHINFAAAQPSWADDLLRTEHVPSEEIFNISSWN